MYDRDVKLKTWRVIKEEIAAPRRQAPRVPGHESALPEWTQEEAVHYEVARECITDMIAVRSAWLEAERQKDAPNTASIERWADERKRYVEELRALSIRDPENSNRVCREYGPELKRLHSGWSSDKSGAE